MDNVHDLGPLIVNKVQQFGLQPAVTSRGDVVLAASRQRRQGWRLVVYNSLWLGDSCHGSNLSCKRSLRGSGPRAELGGHSETALRVSKKAICDNLLGSTGTLTSQTFIPDA
jgi:hypothetical protein